jgi:TonB family protein
VRFDVLPSKEAQSVHISKSSGYPALDAAAVSAVQKWRCTLPDPPTTTVSVEVPFRFNVSGEPLPPTTIRALWAGTYRYDSRREVDDANELSGKRGVLSGTQMIRSTNQIPALLGTGFGIGYAIDSPDPNEVATVRTVWKFPPQGLTNPATGKSATFLERQAQCRVNRDCFTGRHFSEPWELIEGTWEVELWLSDKLAIQQKFIVVKP